MTDERALRLRDLAMSVLRSKGNTCLVGAKKIVVCRVGPLTIRHWPNLGLLELWHSGSKVLEIERWEGKAHVETCLPGAWEQELKEAAKFTCNA